MPLAQVPQDLKLVAQAEFLPADGLVQRAELIGLGRPAGVLLSQVVQVILQTEEGAQSTRKSARGAQGRRTNPQREVRRDDVLDLPVERQGRKKTGADDRDARRFGAVKVVLDDLRSSKRKSRRWSARLFGSGKVGSCRNRDRCGRGSRRVVQKLDTTRLTVAAASFDPGRTNGRWMPRPTTSSSPPGAAARTCRPIRPHPSGL